LSFRPSGTSPRTIRWARQDLDHAAHFLVAADNRIELALARQFGEVPAVAGERFVGRLRILRRDPLGPPHLRERLVQRILGQSQFLQELRNRGAPRFRRERDEEVLGADVLVLQALGFRLCRLKDQAHPWGQADVRAVGLRQRLEQPARLRGSAGRINGHLAEDRRHNAVGLLDQRNEQVLGRDLRVVGFGGEVLGGDHRLLRLLSKFVQVHRRYAALCLAAASRFASAS